MKLSIIIVNYNVAPFLELCLKAAEKSVETANANGFACEILVVDNNSSDGSEQLMNDSFPHLHFIPNKENLGFSKANNQAIRISTAEFVLLLNPDTVVGENTFSEVLRFMDAHADCGALGIKMIDGRGQFLPESKRGVPTPKVSLYKMLGLSKIFTKSKTFNEYHLGYLDKNQNHQVPILSGAFMAMRKEALDKVGLLDEQFFMYGEDIDLSYRIIKGGYQNYYFSDSSIIHYKGESTKKGSLNYVRIFYLAMIIFAKKHFAGQQSWMFSSLVKVGIYLRAMLALLFRLVLVLTPLVLDAIVIFAGSYFIKEVYANNVKGAASYYGPEYLSVNVPLYIGIWLVAVFFSGGYDRPFSLKKLIRGLLVGALLISAVYGFLPEAYRFSRAMILLTAVWSIFMLSGWRQLFGLVSKKEQVIDNSNNTKLAIVASVGEGNRIRQLLLDIGLDMDFIGFIDPENFIEDKHPQKLGEFKDLRELMNLYNINELIFSAKDLRFEQILKSMEDLGDLTDFKIVAENSHHIIGSNSKDDAGNYYLSEQLYRIVKPSQKRNKRVFDLLMSAILLLFSPVFIFIVKNPLSFLQNCFKVIVGKMTWVGFVDYQFEKLPKIRPSVLSPIDPEKLTGLNEKTIERLFQIYAREYSVYQDLATVLKGLRFLGQ